MKRLKRVLWPQVDSVPLRPIWDMKFWVVKSEKSDGRFIVEGFEIINGNHDDWIHEYFDVFRRLSYYDNHFHGKFINAWIQGIDDEYNDKDFFNGIILFIDGDVVEKRNCRIFSVTSRHLLENQRLKKKEEVIEAEVQEYETPEFLAEEKCFWEAIEIFES